MGSAVNSLDVNPPPHFGEHCFVLAPTHATTRKIRR